MTRFNIRIESNTTRSKTRIVLTMTRSKIRIVKRPSLQIGHSCSSCREGGYKQWNEGGSEGASRRGRKQSKKRERRICPAPLATVVSSRMRNTFWLSSSGLVTWGDRMR